jgi:hypothetical protein
MGLNPTLPRRDRPLLTLETQFLRWETHLATLTLSVRLATHNTPKGANNHSVTAPW